MVELLVLAVRKTAENVSNGGDLGDGLGLGNGLLGILNILNNLLHEVGNAVPHAFSLESGDEQWRKWRVGQRGLWKELAVLGIYFGKSKN